MNQIILYNTKSVFAGISTNGYGFHVQVLGIYQTKQKAQAKIDNKDIVEIFPGEISDDFIYKYSSERLGELVVWHDINYMFQRPDWMEMNTFVD